LRLAAGTSPRRDVSARSPVQAQHRFVPERTSRGVGSQNGPGFRTAHRKTPCAAIPARIW
jgi:hypothetical protein